VTEIGDTPPMIVSRYGNRVIEWEPDILAKVLVGLECERERATANTETATLLHTAELIKQAATQHIIEADAPL
jgi:hypothetical protein